MNIGIVGSRTWTSYSIIKDTVLGYIRKNYIDSVTIVSGGAKGADLCGEYLAKEIGFETLIFLPDYDRFGRSAPFVRNQLIVEHSDIVFAFTHGSSGTEHTIKLCHKLKVPVQVIFEKE